MIEPSDFRPGRPHRSPLRRAGVVALALALLGLPGLIGASADAAGRVAVTVTITPAADAVVEGSFVKVSGLVGGAGRAAGAQVVLQRRTPTNKWRTVAASTVTKKSKYVVRFATASGENAVRALVKQTARTHKGVSSVTIIHGLPAGSPKVTGAKPTIQGGIRVGSLLTAKRGTWHPAGAVSFRYQWLRSGKAISGATTVNYRTTPTDAAEEITVRVMGSATGYFSKARLSDPITPKTAEFTTQGTPTITGTNVGVRLTAWTGSWNPKPTSFTYQWLRNSTAIAGATNRTYTVTGADDGTRLRIRVTARRSGYAAASTTSAYTPIINVPVARILADTNAYRSRHSRPALKLSGAMNNVANAWARKMHDTCTMEHNPSFSSQIPRGWTRAGENVAAGQYYTTVVQAWINSAGHRANLLGDYTHIGIGHHSGSTCMKRYFVQNFAKYPG